MARKLGLIFMLLQLQTLTLALPTPLSSSETGSSVASPPASHAWTSQFPQLHDKRYFFPETLPDKAELEEMLRETMRQAGFAASSEPGPRSILPDLDSQLNLQKQKSQQDPGTEIDSAGTSAEPDVRTHRDLRS
ncbi:uncharacterized protein N7515_000907 [Penicillium bovifimosum]|uniref:Uncharacterized protein n=1 Tax=Penicillium bovifimosum TaxID=126998 RepID=A0A9W9HGI1_9EURO|nr:uncharacterized protein N7515_000907 [Penicillium bovifimosum]KAJ5146343.1 hypothetical protein N7515_000907 [Penicillium bovifimosum]